MQIPLLDFVDPQFPNPDRALLEPDGLLAAGGNLKPATILNAYREGIFPWYGEDDPILWWSPSTRCVLYPQKFHQSSSLGRALRRLIYKVTTNSAFAEVIRACSAPRDSAPVDSAPDESADSTWITPEMIEAYGELHRQGYAHSVEVWCDEELAGGSTAFPLAHSSVVNPCLANAQTSQKLPWPISVAGHWIQACS